MLILSNCLTDTPDEGSLKVACTLASHIKAEAPETTVVSYERRSGLTDIHLDLNKLLLSHKLWKLLWKKQEPVLYLPFPTRSLPMAARVFLLSRVCPGNLGVVLSMPRECGLVSRFLLKHSRARLFLLSQSAAEEFARIIGKDRAVYLKTGVDTKRFQPVSPARAAELKEKYGLAPDRMVLLHVGHLKEGRNLSRLTEIDADIQMLLVVSTSTQEDAALRKTLEDCPNIKIRNQYFPNIEELHQLSDVYFFPVTEEYNCIDIPLSCLEAAACGLSVVTTPYGEMAQFRGKPGFFFLETEELNGLLRRALAQPDGVARKAVLEYDWANAARKLKEYLE